MKHLHIIMPMAGFGTRTSDKYEMPKPFIELYDKYLYEYALDGLKPICPYFQVKLTIVAREEMFDSDWDAYDWTVPKHYYDFGLLDELNIVKIKNPTRGALETVMCAEKYIEDNDICIVLDCDLWFNYNRNHHRENELYNILNDIEEDDSTLAGFVLSFNSDKDKYSYATITDDNMVTRTAEKQVISNHALMGVYGFSSGKILKDYARFLLNRKSDYNEYYVSAIYNYIIADGGQVKMLFPDEYMSLGTTMEIDSFLNSDNKFKHLYITDFDGTFVDTKEANYLAYKEVFKKIYDYDLTKQDYYDNFGLRINELLYKLGLDVNKINDVKKMKSRVYKKYFDKIWINWKIQSKLKIAREEGNIICLATTASKKNVDNILKHFKLENFFNYIIYGEDVKNGKPDPEVYNKIIKKYNFVTPDRIHIYEDSDVGLLAAFKTGIPSENIKRITEF